MKPALILVSIAIVLFAWMFRYDVSGQVQWGEGGIARPIMLDRWTGKTYIYYLHPAEKNAIGMWAETGPRKNHQKTLNQFGDPILAPWEANEK